MEVILIKDVNGLGLKGEQHEVNKGYGRYLMTQQMVIVSNRKLAAKASSKLQKRLEQEEQKRQEKMQLRAQLESVKLEIKVGQTKDDAMYAAIGAKEICEALYRQTKQKIDPKKIIIPKKIKKIGTYEVHLNLDLDEPVKLELKVVAKATK
jgi:large subunit ribosomal protein L9